MEWIFSRGVLLIIQIFWNYQFLAKNVERCKYIPLGKLGYVLPGSALSEYSFSSILYYGDATTIYFWTTTIINNKYAPKILLSCITVLIILTTEYSYVFILLYYIICYQQKTYMYSDECLLHNCIFIHCYTTPGRALEMACNS